MSSYELLALLTAVLAVVVSFVSLYRTHRISKRQLELQEIQAAFTRFQHEVLSKEQEVKEQADVRVSLEQRGRDYRLIFTNRGPGTAYHINFELIVSPGDEDPLIASEVEENLPIDELLPGDDHSMLVAPTMGTKFPLRGKVSWRDSSGQAYEQNCRVTL